MAYSLDQLDAFIRTHLAGREIYVTFYGGEPTLNKAYMAEVVDRYPTFRFQLQTNGTLLRKLPPRVLARLSNVLVSIDGGEGVTDGYRGRGIYRQVMRNVEAVRGKVGGTLTARVTLSSAETTLEEIDALLEVFDYVYFQFVAGDVYGPRAMARKRELVSGLVDRFFRRRGALPHDPAHGHRAKQGAAYARGGNSAPARHSAACPPISSTCCPTGASSPARTCSTCLRCNRATSSATG